MKIKLLLLNIALLLFSSCHFISSFSESTENVELSFDKTISTISVGEMEIVNLKASSSNQNEISIKWEYDDSVIMAKTDNYSAVITGLKPGKTSLKATCGSNSVTCVINITDETFSVRITNPYVYASNDYIEIKPNQTQKISASLFGGTSSDINGYTWSIDKPSVASLSTEGNYCWVTGINDGIAKLTVKHNKTPYGYSVLINCSSDGSTLTYITTNENIITINKSEENTKEFAVDLMNPILTEYASGFSYSVVDEQGNEVKGALVISGAGSLNVSLTAYEVGKYYVRCSHPNAIYPLDVLVRVIENAEVAYIEPSTGSQVTIRGNESQNISLSLVNYSKEVDNNLFKWSFSENAHNYISYEVYNGNAENTGNNILIKGIKTGSCKITVSYPGIADRNIIVLVRDIESEAASVKTYITTSQNYIKMGLNDEPSNISIILTDSENCDINDLKWSIINCAADGSSKDVIQWVVGTGNSVSSSLNSRDVLVENLMASATIKPVNCGIAYIDISHPKAIYKTRITVTVTESSSQKELYSSLSLTGSPVVNILNGKTETISVGFKGDGEVNEIEWNCSNSLITISPNGNECVINSLISGSGVQKATITASHKNAKYPVTFSVLCYDTDEELQNNAIKTMYYLGDSKTELFVNNQLRLYVYTEGFTENQTISWSCTQGERLISFETLENNQTILVTANSVGQAIIKASSEGVDDIFFIIDVKDINVIDEEATCYLSTNTNVVYFEDKNISQDILISAYNINESNYSDIVFSCDSSDFEIASNGNKATITALKENVKAILTVSHPLSENTLEINLHCGEQFEYVNEDFCFISTDKDNIELYAGQDEVQLTATLNHTDFSDEETIVKGFSFVSDNPDVVSVSYLTYSNYCFVKPLKNGTAKITITHPDSDFEKEVIVVVNHAPDISTIPFITTKTNVITVLEGEYVTASVELKNSTNIDSSKWHWITSDSRICDVVANNGTTSMISANKPGTTEITVKHDDCIYSLKLIIVVIDSSIVTSRPFIKASDNIITLKKGTSTTITAEMIGGNSESDKNYFRFNGSNSSIIMVNGVSDAAFVKGVNTGMAYVTISNARYSDSYSKTVLIIVEDTQEEGVYIKPSSSIVKMKPDEVDFVKISAEVVGGEATDGERLIWWVDDPNLIGITSVADQCSIIPTGKTGTTKIHIKHEKAMKTCDILVMISDYETFAFSKLSANISTEKLYFIPLQVPAIEEEFEIQYFSSNEDVCIVQGSNAVAWICGRSYGNASLTAKMVSKDGVELASSEMLVSVTVPDVKLPIISLGYSILTVEAGTSQTLSAVISSNDIEETEKFNLKWSWTCGKGDSIDGISFLNEYDKTAYGPDTYITFNEAGEYVLYVTHEETGAFSSMYLIVEDKGEVSIELNSYLETINKDDGSISLTATLINGTENDYKNIEWSAIKVGGQSIVAVSKAKGKTCTVTPKNVGQTTVIAKLPNGNTAKCVVIVQASAELVLDLGSIHVIPGYTEVINYKTIPENATVNWLTQMTNNNSLNGETYFSFEDDTAKKQLKITGLVVHPGSAAGTISGYIMGASSGNMANVKVFVEYDLELSLFRDKGENQNHLTILSNEKPDTENIKQFTIKYYPIDLDIDISDERHTLVCIPYEQNELKHEQNNDNPLFSIGNINKEIITEDGRQKCLLTIDVIPRSEGEETITVKASLPNKDVNISKTKSFIYNAYYENGYQIYVENYTPVGAFTKFEKGILYITDGEEAVFTAKIKNENAAGKIDTNNLDWSVSGFGNNNDASTELSKAKENIIYSKDSSRFDKAQEVFGKTTIVTKDDVHKNATDENCKPKKGVVYFTTEKDSSGQTFIKLSHNWDYYVDLPTDIISEDGSNTAWEKYKQENIYNDDFLKNLQDKNVEYWLISKEAYFKYNNKAVHFVDHPAAFGTNNGIKISNSWQINSGRKQTSEAWYYANYRFETISQTITFDGSSYTVFSFTAPKNSEKKCFDYNTNTSFVLKDCKPYVITTDELMKNYFLTIPDDKNKIRHSYWPTSGGIGKEGEGENHWEEDSYISKLLHDGITPTISKDTNKTTIGKGKLTIRYTDGKGEPHSREVIVVFEKRLCEAYTNNTWNKQTCGSYDHWYIDKNSLF